MYVKGLISMFKPNKPFLSMAVSKLWYVHKNCAMSKYREKGKKQMEMYV